MGKGLGVSKQEFEEEVKQILNEGARKALLSIFLLTRTDMGDQMAESFGKTFSEQVAPRLTTSIMNFIKESQILGTINGMVSVTTPMGLGSGTNIDTLNGTELSIN